jgi:hypothetical protein
MEQLLLLIQSNNQALKILVLEFARKLAVFRKW